MHFKQWGTPWPMAPLIQVNWTFDFRLQGVFNVFSTIYSPGFELARRSQKYKRIMKYLFNLITNRIDRPVTFNFYRSFIQVFPFMSYFHTAVNFAHELLYSRDLKQRLKLRRESRHGPNFTCVCGVEHRLAKAKIANLTTVTRLYILFIFFESSHQNCQ